MPYRADEIRRVGEVGITFTFWYTMRVILESKLRGTRKELTIILQFETSNGKKFAI